MFGAHSDLRLNSTNRWVMSPLMGEPSCEWQRGEVIVGMMTAQQRGVGSSNTSTVVISWSSVGSPSASSVAWSAER